MKPILLFILLALPLSLHAQGTLRGKVVDNDGSSLAGATIRVDERSSAVTDARGMFVVTGLGAGRHNVDVSFISYTTQRTVVDIADAQATSVTIKLEPGAVQLRDVTVSAAAERPLNTLSAVDIKFRPVNSAQDVLRMVPGLFIAQHAGGGKAEQIFLRGFDADHGTDVNIEVDGLPVNMVSHAHGQGYADLHFLIPELISFVDFDKGPYFAAKGDLTTAGYVAFETKRRLDANFIKLEGGSFGTARAVAGINLPTRSTRSSGYIASDFSRTDGYFESGQDFKRFNIQGRFNTQLGDNTYLTAALSAFSSSWDASGQIPDRAVTDGTITRFGSIDPTEGGNTSRYNAYVKVLHQVGNNATWEHQLYATRYNFSLYSNFTFFLHDSINGDQIHQAEGRWIYGYKSTYNKTSLLAGKKLATEAGAGVRYDVINDIALSHTVKREFLNDVKRGDIREGNVNAYLSETLWLTPRLSANAAVRFDYFRFAYTDKLMNDQRAMATRAVVSPKLNVSYQLTNNTALYLRAGQGFHSNDARLVATNAVQQTLPKAYGVDLGTSIKATPTTLVHAAVWLLDLDQEFVYVGDEGVVEPSGRTRRTGIDLSIRQQLTPWLFADLDVNLTRPRAKDEPEGANYIPLAPTVSSIGGLTFKRSNGFNGSLRYRYIGNRAANEDNSVVADGYFIVDATVNYSMRRFEVGMSVENLFNEKWKEAQFDTESRLQNEPAPVSEIHYTPGTPVALKVRVVKYF